MQPHTGQFGPPSQPGGAQDANHRQDDQPQGNPTQIGHPEPREAADAGKRRQSQPESSTLGQHGSQGRASGFQGNSIQEYQEVPEDFGADLPPPPSDSNQFEVPRPSKPAEAKTSERPAPEETSSAEFVFEFVRIALFGVVAAIGLYIAFLVVSTIFGHFLSGDLKLVASLILASAIPLLTALGENSKRERFEVVDKPYDRVVRVFVGTAIFSFGTAVICSLAMSGAVVHELRTFPNWFLSDSQRQTSFGDFNAKVSLGLAQVVEEATSAIGIYEGKSHADTRAKTGPSKPVIAKPPAPTRPSTLSCATAPSPAVRRTSNAGSPMPPRTGRARISRSGAKRPRARCSTRWSV
jgi:hypothetical protein